MCPQGPDWEIALPVYYKDEVCVEAEVSFALPVWFLVPECFNWVLQVDFQMPHVRLAATGMDSCPASDEDTEDELEAARRPGAFRARHMLHSRQPVSQIKIIIWALKSGLKW